MLPGVMQDAGKSSRMEAKSLLDDFRPRNTLEHKFSAEAHYKNLLPIRSPKCLHTPIGQRTSRVLFPTFSAPFLPCITSPRRSALFVPPKYVSQSVPWNSYPSIKKRKFWLKQRCTGFTMIMVLLRMGNAEFPKLCGHGNSSSQRISREQYPQKHFWKMQPESTLLH